MNYAFESFSEIWDLWVKHGSHNVLTVECLDRDGDKHTLRFTRECVSGNPVFANALEYISKNYDVTDLGWNTVYVLKKF